MKFVIIIFALLICALMVYAVKKMDNNGIYVHTKTGNEYRIIHYGKLKNPDTGVWSDCVIYHGITHPGIYAREHFSFFQSFVKKKVWKENNAKRDIN